MLCDSVVIVVVLRTRPRAIPLAMITMRNFLLFPIYGMLMGLRLAARHNGLGLTDEDNSVPRTDHVVNVNVFNTVTSARVLSYRWVCQQFQSVASKLSLFTNDPCSKLSGS